jgi:hypothetical protein
MSEYNLTQEIVNLSQSKIWDVAKLEWGLYEICEAEEPEECLCGHYPIIEICILQNKLNGKFASVGNCCVKKFIGLPSDLIFQAIKRVRKDNEKSLNSEAINYAFNKGWISAWEFDFSIDTMRKRSLSEKQLQIRVKINEKILSYMKKQNTIR